MGMSRYKLAAQLLALAMFTGLALWHYLMRHYDLILPPALLACGLLASLPLQWLGRLRPALADYLMLVGALTLFAIEAPGCVNGMLWLGLPAAVSLLVLSLPLAVLLNVALVPAWMLLLGGTHVSLLTLSMGWWLSLSAALVLSSLDARRRRALLLPQWRRDPKLPRQALQRSLSIEIARAHALGRPLSVLVLYVPQIDQADDQFGTELREALSHAFSHAVVNDSRHSDLLGEYRENVFCLILPNAGESGALAAGRRLTATVATISRPETGPLESFSRVCMLQPGEATAHFLTRLDNAATKLLEPLA